MSIPTSPLGLYVIDGLVVHSYDGPLSALSKAKRDEPIELATVGAIFPDGFVEYGPEYPTLWFDAKERALKNCPTPGTAGRIEACHYYPGRIKPSHYVVELIKMRPEGFSRRLTSRHEHPLEAYLEALEEMQS